MSSVTSISTSGQIFNPELSGATGAVTIAAPNAVNTTSTAQTKSGPLTVATLNATLIASPDANGVLAVFNVKDFGATGNGSTNDASAIQSAITAAASTNATVYFPPGTYFLSASSLSATTNARLVGSGGKTIITGTAAPLLDVSYTQNATGNAVAAPYIEGLAFRPTSTNTALYFASNSYAIDNPCPAPVIRNCVFDGTQNGNAVATLLVLQFGTYVVVDTCSFTGPLGIGDPSLKVTALEMLGTTCCVVSNCNFSFFQYGIKIGSNGGSNVPQQTTINSCNLNGCGTSIYANPASYLVVSNCLCDNGTTPIYCTGSNGIYISNCYLATNAGVGAGQTVLQLFSTGNIFIRDNALTAYNSGNELMYFDNPQNGTVSSNVLYFTASGAVGVAVTVAGTPSQFTITDNKFSGSIDVYFALPALTYGLNTVPLKIKDNYPFNPVGYVGPPAIPSSGASFYNPFPYDCTVYVHVGNATGFNIAVQGHSLNVPASATFVSVQLPVGAYLQLIYTAGNQLAWTWLAD